MYWRQSKSNSSELDRRGHPDNGPGPDHVLVLDHNPKPHFLLGDCSNRPSRIPAGILPWTGHNRLSVTDIGSKVRIAFEGCSHHRRREDQRGVIASCRDCRETSWGSGHNDYCIHCLLLQRGGHCYKSCRLVQGRIHAALKSCRKSVARENRQRKKKEKRNEEVERRVIRRKDPCKETGSYCGILGKADDGEAGEDLLAGTTCRTIGVGGIAGKDED